MRISDWSSDVCSSDLASPALGPGEAAVRPGLLAPLHLEGAVRDPDDAGHLDGDTALTDHLEGVVAAGEPVEHLRPATSERRRGGQQGGSTRCTWVSR